jgi:hypothetical protein
VKQESELLTALSRRSMLLFGSGLAAFGLGNLAALDADAKKRKRRRRKNKKRKKGKGGFTVAAPDMTGAKEVPPEDGDPNGQGSAVCTVKGNEICCDFEFETTTENSAITAIHIHPGAVGEEGDPVVPFSTALQDNCAIADEGLAAQIKNNPEEFYMNIHTAAHPNGAVRDQLQAQS